MVNDSSISLPEVFLKQAFRLYSRLGFKIDQHHLNRGYPGPLHFLYEAQHQGISGRKQAQTNHGRDMSHLIDSIVPYTTEMGDGRWKSVHTFSKEVVSSLTSSEQFDKFYVIHGAAGTGKSVYLATLFEAIKHEMCNNDQLNPLEDIKEYSLPLFHSNLKHLTRYEQLDARLVLEGIGSDLFPTQELWSPTQLGNLIYPPNNQHNRYKGVILIDSLDEYITNTAKSTPLTYEQIRKSLVETHSQFVEAGFIPVWSCRTREYHLLKMVEEKNWNVKASTPPALDTTRMAKYCFCEGQKTGILGEIRAYSGMEKSDHIEVSKLLQWILKSASVNPLFFYFRTFTKNKSEAKVLTHSLIKRMEQAFNDVDQSKVLTHQSVMELQNQFVLSDFVVQTLLHYIYSNYTSPKYSINESVSNVVDSLQKWVDDWDTAGEQNLEHFTSIFRSMGIDESKVEDDINFRLMRYYGLIAKTDANNWIWRHRSFPEYLCVSDPSGLTVRPERISKIRERWEDQHFNRSVWKWRTWSNEWEASRSIICDRTGAYATSLDASMFSEIPEYIELFSDTDDKVDDERLEGEFGFSRTQLNIIQRGVQKNKAIVLKGWPGTGKTYTGTHMLLGRLVNAHLQSGRAEYDPELASQGLIITLNPDLSKYLKEDLDQYKTGPWSLLAPTIEWASLKQSVSVLSMEEIVSKLDRTDNTNGKLNPIHLKDLRQIQQDHWRTFCKRCKQRNDWEYDPAYDWKKASREYQESFMDELGDFYESYSDIDPLFPNHQNASTQWFEYVKTAVFPPKSASIPLQTACIKLVHRFIQAFDYHPDHGEYKGLPDTRLNNADDRTTEEILASMRTNPLLMDFSNALIDEVQDLPVEACLLISLLVHRGAGNQRSRVMFAGDEYQVLNQSNFEWSQFSQLYERKIAQLKKRYGGGQISANSYLYLTASPNVTDEPFIENFRNTPDIVTTWKRAGSWTPSNLDIEPLEGIEEATCIRKQSENTQKSVTLITYPEKARNPYSDLIMGIDDIIKNHSGVAFISMAPAVDRLLRNKKIEHFTPFTIKGLERNNAVVVGSLLFDKNRNFTEDEVKDERMKMIVGLSRAKNSMILVLPSVQLRNDHTVRVGRVDQTQNSLEHILERAPGQYHEHIHHLEAKDLREVQWHIERIVGGDDEGRAILAIDEYLAAQAYGSEQLNSIKKRVEEICRKDIIDAEKNNQVSYFWKMLQSLNFLGKGLPAFLDIFILTNDTMTKLREDDVTLDGTSISGTLKIYQRDWINGDEEPFFKILVRYNLYKRFNEVIEDLSDLEAPHGGNSESFALTFNRIRSRILDGMKNLLSDMQFSKYHWHEHNGLVKNSRRIALLHYLVMDYLDIEKSVKEQEKNPTKNRLAHAESLLVLISQVSSKDYREFLNHIPKSESTLKEAIGVILRLIPDNETSIGYFLNGFPVTEYDRILSTDAIVRLIQYIMDNRHDGRRKKFRNQLSRLFVVFCSAKRQTELSSVSGQDYGLTKEEFVEVYAGLDAREQNHVSAKNLTFEYAQHILSRRFFESGFNSDLTEYRNKLDNLFIQSLNSSSIMDARLRTDERYLMPSDSMNTTGVSRATRTLFEVVCDFASKVLALLSDPSNSERFNQNGTINRELNEIITILLMYSSDDYLRDNSVFILEPDTQFNELLMRMNHQRRIDFDDLMSKFIHQTQQNLKKTERISQKRVLLSWASIRYIIDVLDHHPSSELIHQLQEISAAYPFLMLNEEYRKPIVAVDDMGRFRIPSMNNFQQSSRRLALDMKVHRTKFRYFARSPYSEFKPDKTTHLGSPVFLRATKEWWCRISWEEYIQIATTAEQSGLGNIPVHIHKNSLPELPTLLSTVRQKAKDRLLNAKSRVGVETIVNLVRKVHPLNTSIPFILDLDEDIASAKKSEAYSVLLRDVDKIVADTISVGTGGDGKLRDAQLRKRQELKNKLLKERESTVIVQELWIQAIKRILENSFKLSLDKNSNNKTLFVDIQKSLDAINRLYRGE